MRVSNRLFYMFFVLLFAVLACQGTGNSSSSSSSSANSSTSNPPTPNPALAPVSLPVQRLDQASDVNSSENATKKQVSGGDVFVEGLYERPFSANTMDKYFPYVDIVNTQGFKDNTWGFATITLAGDDSNGHLPAQYAVELDLNKDGRGDWLIRAADPASTSWTTQGVQAWKDTDGDIGGSIPTIADNKPNGGDGYETLVFDQGKGSLTDGAWVRIAPNDPKSVQIAFKLSMLGNPKSYAMGSWAGTNIDPSTFDVNDHMTHIQAGSPNLGDGVYPIKALAEIDNTCRLAIGFVPTGREPGLCKTIALGGAAPGTCPFPASQCYPYSQNPYPNCTCNIPK